MNKETLRIVYMGTPDFAVEPLKALLDGGYNVVGVVTMPDKPMGRHGNTLQASPVKHFAVEHGIKVMQPEKLKDEAFLEELAELDADLQIVVAFRMLPEVVWNMPHLGTFNLHASLLPQYRGAAPINWAIINGEKETGVTTFFLNHDIDTGEVIKQVKVPIGDDENVGDIHDKLMVVGAKLVTDTVDRIIDGTLHTVDQDLMYGENETLKPAPKIFRETCQIDWNQTIKKVYDFVRGLSPYPAAWTVLDEGGQLRDVKIYSTREGEESHGLISGTIDTDQKSYMKVATSNGWIYITTLQLAGKKRMDISEFLRGTKISSNARFL